MAERKKRKVAWDARNVHALRAHLALTQEQMAAELGTRQQTISEWETGQYQPRGASARLLTLIAERAGFVYGATPDSESERKGEG
jgi:DNA-binding transcriptional regulator YiaG